MIYLDVMTRGALEVKSPMDRLRAYPRAATQATNIIVSQTLGIETTSSL